MESRPTKFHFNISVLVTVRQRRSDLSPQLYFSRNYPSFQQCNQFYTLDLAGHNIKNTTSIRSMATPARHKSKPVSDPMKNKAAINDKAATKNRTI